MRFALACIFLLIATHSDDVCACVTAVGWALFLCLWKIADLINNQRH